MVQQRVNPLLEMTSARVQEILASVRGRAAEKVDALNGSNGTSVSNGINGTAHANGNGTAHI